jgi:hypothetical protein
MKNVFLLIIILMTAIGLLNIHYYNIDAQEIYENKNLGIKFTIPENFEVSEESDLNKIILSPKNMIENIYYQISIESLESNNGETLEKWLRNYLKDNYNDKDNFRIDVGPSGEPTPLKYSNNQYNGYSFDLLDRVKNNYNEHDFVSVNDKIFHFSYSAPTNLDDYQKYLYEYRNLNQMVEFIN